LIPTPKIPVFRWAMYHPSQKPGDTLAMLVRDGQLVARVLVSNEPGAQHMHAVEWRLMDGDLIVRSGLRETLPQAVKAVELERQVWNQKLTEEQRETARENARWRAACE
jgi:hypothetical protein